jgi:hypothetical protein
LELPWKNTAFSLNLLAILAAAAKLRPVSQLAEAVSFISKFKGLYPAANKAAVQEAFVARFNPQRHRSIFQCDGFAIRFCEANTASFSNVVLSLSALQPFDSLPIVACVVRPARVDLLLMNTTFLNKISHSSKTLRVDNLRGSFLGSY